MRKKPDWGPPRKPIFHYPPLLDLIQPIAEEICPDYFGYVLRKDEKSMFEVFATAALIRYLRMGVDPTKWADKKRLELARSFVHD